MKSETTNYHFLMKYNSIYVFTLLSQSVTSFIDGPINPTAALTTPSIMIFFVMAKTFQATLSTNHAYSVSLRRVQSSFIWRENRKQILSLKNTVKPMYNDYPRDPKIVAVVDGWSLFRGSFMF